MKKTTLLQLILAILLFSISGISYKSVYSQGVYEETIGKSWFDLQTHSTSQNRVYYYDDGTIGTVFTMTQDFPGYEDRGTGYNYYDGNSWGPEPNQALESQRSGFPVYAPWGENGEIIVSHLSGAEDEGLMILTRMEKGNGDWSEQLFTGPEGHEALYWPSMTTGGVDHNTIHLLALTAPGDVGGTPYLGQNGALLYSRSTDGGLTWNPHNIVLPGMGADNYLGFEGHTYFMRAKEENVAIVIGDFTYDMILMKSNDGGDTWAKTIIWEHPYPLLDVETIVSTDTFYCVDGAVHLDFDPENKAHIVFGISRGVVEEGDDILTWFPEVDGIGYWNENRATFSNHLNALSPYDDFGSELEIDYSLIGWSQDINGNGQLDVLNEWGQYYVGFSSMPQITIEEYGNYYQIIVVYSSVTETFNNGLQNYRHLWGRSSPNQGEWWGGFSDLTADLVHIFDECVFPSLAETTDEGFFLVYQLDTEPGLVIWGDLDPPSENHEVFMEYQWMTFTDTERNNQDFKVSINNPNPFTEFTNINVELEASSKLQLSISDISGKILRSENLGMYHRGKNNIIINREKLSSGFYFFTITSEHGSITQKMIIE